MTKDYFIHLIELQTSHVEFDYKGEGGLIDPISYDYYDLFYGDEIEIRCKGIDAVLNTPFIDGKSINDLFDKLEFW